MLLSQRYVGAINSNALVHSCGATYVHFLSFHAFCGKNVAKWKGLPPPLGLLGAIRLGNSGSDLQCDNDVSRIQGNSELVNGCAMV